MASFNVKGLAELNRVLNQLPVKVERKLLRGGLRAAAKVIEAEAKRRVPVRTGLLRDSIRVSTGAKRGGKVYAHIKAGGRKKGQAFYAHMVEFGTARHVILAGGGTKAGKALAIAGRILGAKVDHPGARPRPFMRPALDTQAQKSVEEMAEYLRKRIAEAVK